MSDWSKQNCVTKKSPMDFALNPNIPYYMYNSQGKVRVKLIGRGNAEMQNLRLLNLKISIILPSICIRKHSFIY